MCRLARVSVTELVNIVATLDTTIQVRAIVSPRENQPEISSDVVSLPFLPAFHVHSDEVVLSNLQPLGAIRISATDRVAQDIKVGALWHHSAFCLWFIFK